MIINLFTCYRIIIVFRSSAYGLYFVNTVWNQCRELLENLQETTCTREDDQHRIKKLWNNIGLYTGNTSTSRLKYCVVKERVICLCTNNSLYQDSFRNIRYLKILDISSDRYKGIFFFLPIQLFPYLQNNVWKEIGGDSCFMTDFVLPFKVQKKTENFCGYFNSENLTAVPLPFH